MSIQASPHRCPHCGASINIGQLQLEHLSRHGYMGEGVVSQVDPAPNAATPLVPSPSFVVTLGGSGGVALTPACAHLRATFTIGPTTDQRNHRCPDCHAVWTTWPERSAPVGAAAPVPELTERITAYLSGGGLFNPELAAHDDFTYAQCDRMHSGSCCEDPDCHRSPVAAPGAMSLQEVWEAAGGNPGIQPSREEVLTALRLLDAACDEADDKPAPARGLASLDAGARA